MLDKEKQDSWTKRTTNSNLTIDLTCSQTYVQTAFKKPEPVKLNFYTSFQLDHEDKATKRPKTSTRKRQHQQRGWGANK